LRAHNLMFRDQDYVVKDDQVMIVDEFTGRIMPGRRYSDGLHQAIEAKERVKVKRESKTLASITFQNFCNLFAKKCGMTGTALTEENEFREIYGMDVVEIPTNRPVIRIDHQDAVYKTKEEKLRAIDNVSGVDFVDKSRGLTDLREQFGDDAWLLDGLEHDNPIRHCYHIWVVDIDNYEETIKAIENTKGIANVRDSLDAVKQLLNIRQILSAVSVSFVVLLGMVAIFIISNTIKLATFDRRQEIGIMKMIGATDGFVRMPMDAIYLTISRISSGSPWYGT